MNALSGGVKIFPVVSFTIWYSPAGFEGVVSTDAHLMDGDGDLLMVYAGARLKVIGVAQVNRIVTHQVAVGEEINAQEIQEYDQFWADR